MIIEVKNLQKKFEDEVVLDNISFQVNKGETFGILGPSGAGKTTLIQNMTGDLKPTNGYLYINGYPHSSFRQSDYQKKIGVLSDNSTLYERLTVKDNLVFFQELYEAEYSMIDYAIEQVGLAEVSKKEVNKLSKGMKQRVLLCKSLLHKPDILFLDEPTSAIDPATADQIHELLNQLKYEGTTIILTTHNMDEALKLCDTVAFLDEGIIQEIGEPKKLQENYKKNEIHVNYKNGSKKTIMQNENQINELIKVVNDPDVFHFESDLPSLGDIFKTITGKELE